MAAFTEPRASASGSVPNFAAWAESVRPSIFPHKADETFYIHIDFQESFSDNKPLARLSPKDPESGRHNISR
jgi:hypothetical protein